jgi:hypothetical protein
MAKRKVPSSRPKETKVSILMICFEVQINGVTKCCAGVQQYGVAVVTLDYVNRNPKLVPDHVPLDMRNLKDLRLVVGGRISDSHPVQEVQWASEELHVGDVVQVRILENANCSEPLTRKPVDS